MNWTHLGLYQKRRCFRCNAWTRPVSYSTRRRAICESICRAWVIVVGPCRRRGRVKSIVDSQECAAQTNVEISAPSNFRQTASVTAASVRPAPAQHSEPRARPPPAQQARSFDVDSLPPEIFAIFEAAGMSRDDLRDPTMAEFAFNFVKQHLDALDGGGKANAHASPLPTTSVQQPHLRADPARTNRSDVSDDAACLFLFVVWMHVVWHI